MGASGWHYVTPYEGSVGATLKALHAKVFEDKVRADGWGSIAELWADEEFMGTQGTHTVLDVPNIAEPGTETDPWSDEAWCCLLPLGPEAVTRHLGAARPGVRQFEEAVTRATGRRSPGEEHLLDEPCQRYSGWYVLLHAEPGAAGEPTHMGIFGRSGD